MITKRYLLIDIGCLECRDQTTVHGTFDSQDDAEAYLLQSWHDANPDRKSPPSPDWFKVDETVPIGATTIDAQGQSYLILVDLQPETTP